MGSWKACIHIGSRSIESARGQIFFIPTEIVPEFMQISEVNLLLKPGNLTSRPRPNIVQIEEDLRWSWVI